MLSGLMAVFTENRTERLVTNLPAITFGYLYTQTNSQIHLVVAAAAFIGAACGAAFLIQLQKLAEPVGGTLSWGNVFRAVAIAKPDSTLVQLILLPTFLLYLCSIPASPVLLFVRLTEGDLIISGLCFMWVIILSDVVAGSVLDLDSISTDNFEYNPSDTEESREQASVD